MRQGQIINGYEVTSRPSNADAGKCLWAFASRDGKEYFIKEFLDPKRPRADSMGSVADKERRFAECERFEKRQRRVAGLLRGDHPQAGNLVLTVDFFVDGTRYYKVTKRVHGADVRPHELDTDQQTVLLRTLVDSLCLLHQHAIVHGDLKPENILLHQPNASGLYTAKLIDFDDAYPAGEPPPREVVGGNPLYGAPEWLRYLRDDRAVQAEELTQAADMFSFGLLVHNYLTGELPAFPESHDSPAAAVLAGATLRWHKRLPGPWTELLPTLTDADPAARPDIDQIAGVLDGGAVPEPAPAARRSRVRVNLSGRARPEAKPGGRLRINMAGDHH
jgi:serine/threonine protein kinase